MTLMRRNSYDPFEEMDRMVERMRSIMSSAFLPVTADVVQPTDANLLAIDMTSDENSVTVRTALPGFKQDEVNVDVQGNVLTITAESKSEREDNQKSWHIREMRYGKFARSVVLPDDVTADKADASLEDGVLTVKLMKKQPSTVQKIAVKARNLLKAGK